MKNRDDIILFLKKALKIESPFLLMISLFLAIGVWWWVKIHVVR